MDDKLLTITVTIPKPSRRWLQVGLLTLLLVTVLAGTWLGLAGEYFRQHREPAAPTQPTRRAVFLARVRLARQRNLAEMVGMMKGIRNASVEIGTKQGQAAETVTVSVLPEAQSVSSRDVASIRTLVAGSGLSKVDVSVLDLKEDQAEIFAHLLTEPARIHARLAVDGILERKVERLKATLSQFCRDINDRFWQRVYESRLPFDY